MSLAHTDPDNDSEPHLLDFNNTGTRNPRGFHSHFGVSVMGSAAQNELTCLDLVDPFLG